MKDRLSWPTYPHHTVYHACALGCSGPAMTVRCNLLRFYLPPLPHVLQCALWLPLLVTHHQVTG